jgi:hypothetical protein
MTRGNGSCVSTYLDALDEPIMAVHSRGERPTPDYVEMWRSCASHPLQDVLQVRKDCHRPVCKRKDAVLRPHRAGIQRDLERHADIP